MAAREKEALIEKCNKRVKYNIRRMQTRITKILPKKEIIYEKWCIFLRW